MSTVFDEELKIWSGPNIPPLINAKKVSVGQLLLTSLYRRPNAVGQICHDDGSTMTNGEILSDSIRASLNYQDLGLKQGDVIGVMAKNHSKLVSLLIGALLNGNPVSTLDPSFDYEFILKTYSITEPKVVICEEENMKDVTAAFDKMGKSCKFFVFGEGEDLFENVEKLFNPHPKEELYIPPEIDDATVLPAIILCTSGTTGPPKSIPISHASLIYNLTKSNPLDAGLKLFSFSTMYWLTGWYILFASHYRNYVRIITTEYGSPTLMLEILRARRPFGIFIQPPYMAQLLKEETLTPSDFDSVKMVSCAGCHLIPEIGIQMKKYLRNGILVYVYGMSEVTGAITNNIFIDKSSCGKLKPGVQVKVIDENGNQLGVGESGEICIKTVFPFLGYYKNEIETNKIMRDGWVHSGDIGFFDEEGDLYVHNRKKDLLRTTRGFTLYQLNPSEIESVILQIEDVLMVAVVGIPDPIRTEIPAALVLRKKDSSLNAMQITEHVMSNLPDTKWLYGGAYFTDEMPLTASGKIQKYICKDIIMKEYHPNNGLLIPT